ncbi:MAG: hypothetical protein ACE5D7_03300 [Fidelibacterota bacterium]
MEIKSNLGKSDFISLLLKIGLAESHKVDEKKDLRKILPESELHFKTCPPVISENF